MPFLLKRCLSALFTLLLAFVLVFLLLRFIPGDPVELMLGEQAHVSQKEHLRRALGLDQPMGKQLLTNLRALAQLDLGQSLALRQPVTELIAARFPATLALALAAMSVAITLAFPLGLLAGAKPHSWVDYLSRLIAMLGISIPNFWLGPMLLLLFAVTWSCLPVGGYQQFRSLVLPALTLGSALAAILTRMLRTSLIDTQKKLFITTAKAKGASARYTLFHHALRPSLLPVTTILGLQLGALLSGAVITETVFQWPGMGRLFIQAVQARDYPVIQGVVLFFTTIYITVNLFVDLVYSLLDPRIRRRT